VRGAATDARGAKLSGGVASASPDRERGNDRCRQKIGFDGEAVGGDRRADPVERRGRYLAVFGFAACAGIYFAAESGCIMPKILPSVSFA
jgi:hypothetical protein